MPGKFREVRSITIKRKHINLNGDDRFGHWWFEIGDAFDPRSESYGWWPRHAVTLADTFLGVPGELNGQSEFGGEPMRDPHHGDDAGQAFHPLVPASDPRTDGEIAECLRSFARGYSGTWEWRFGKGQNCHTFQERALKHCKLYIRRPKAWL